MIATGQRPRPASAPWASPRPSAHLMDHDTDPLIEAEAIGVVGVVEADDGKETAVTAAPGCEPVLVSRTQVRRRHDPGCGRCRLQAQDGCAGTPALGGGGSRRPIRTAGIDIADLADWPATSRQCKVAT